MTRNFNVYLTAKSEYYGLDFEAVRSATTGILERPRHETVVGFGALILHPYPGTACER